MDIVGIKIFIKIICHIVTHIRKIFGVDVILFAADDSHMQIGLFDGIHIIIASTVGKCPDRIPVHQKLHLIIQHRLPAMSIHNTIICHKRSGNSQKDRQCTAYDRYDHHNQCTLFKSSVFLLIPFGFCTGRTLFFIFFFVLITFFIPGFFLYAGNTFPVVCFIDSIPAVGRFIHPNNLLLFLPSVFQFIASSPHDLYKSRVGRIDLDFFTQMTNMYGDRALIAD